MRISRLARSIDPSPTLKLNDAARMLRARGEPVIHLGIGEPKNKAPIAAILGAAAKLSEGNIKYAPTDGIPALKKAIIRYTEENYAREVKPENVIVSNGAKQSIYNILYSIVDPKDEVIILAPYWVSYPQMIKMVRGVPKVVNPEDGTFYPRMEDIKQAASSSTRAIIVNNPNNPSGAIYSESFIAELVDFCETKGIYLIMDDIYQKLIFNGIIVRPGYDFTSKEVENSHIIVINGVSKMFGMTGIRIGWVIANQELVERMKSIQGQTTSCPSVVSQAAAEGALTGPRSAIESLRLTIENNCNVMLQALGSFKGVKVMPPRGTFYCLPDFREYSRDSVKLAEFLLEKALVVTVPGKAFGMEGYLRLSFAGSVKDVIEGVERLKWALDPTSPREIYIGNQKRVRDWL